MCEDNPDLKFLVVVYNKSTQKHAEEHFPKKNTTCITAHSLAWNAVGFRYNGPYINLKARDIMNTNLLEGMGYTIKQQRAGQVAKTIDNFMNSNDPEIESEHVPSRWTKVKRDRRPMTWGAALGREEVTLMPNERSEILDYAIQAWEIIIGRYI